MSASTRGQALDIKRFNETAAYRRKMGIPTMIDIENAAVEAGRRAYDHCVKRYGEEAMSIDPEKRRETLFSSVFQYEASIGREMDKDERWFFIQRATETVCDSMTIKIQWE